MDLDSSDKRKEVVVYTGLNDSMSFLNLVKSSTGLLGWATLNDLAEKTEGLPFAG